MSDLPLEESSSGRRVRRVETAETMARRQRQISVSEFFTKNRHLLGFDNPRKALMTAVKEAVDNALDACEEAGILPEVVVRIHELAPERYRVMVRDNGPGILKSQIPNIFAKLLYGSKFHRLKMSRGQQGIGISAAGMYGLLTTGQPIRVISRTGEHRAAHFVELRIDTKKNAPEVMRELEVPWVSPRGTEVTLELKGKYARGRQSVDEYLRQVAIGNPHVRILYRAPDATNAVYEPSSPVLPPAVE
ncbi:MAG: DNA topoisomerase VI subunit B, partial [Deltaproteobacteria bacterium]|nr:DNA topoisomerase VI subunit B [Deltaproteobacteria bacterium]